MSYQANLTKTVPKILCIGKNYIKHVKEMGGTEAPKTPVIFFKPWSSISFNPQQLSLPIASSHQIDHELELGVWIGKSGKNIEKSDALKHVGGYFIGIDFTDRDFQQIAKKGGLPWQLSKGQDNFCPLSPLIEGQIDPYSIELQLKVNGAIRQKDFAGNMHFKIDQIISYSSKFFTLNEGDLILTGTPDGVGPVKSGDKVEGIGRIGDKIIASLNFVVTN